MEQLHQTLAKDRAELDRMINKKAELTAEVDTLEKIRSVLPNWCSDGESGNESDGR